jgi:hypothetical protein
MAVSAAAAAAIGVALVSAGSAADAGTRVATVHQHATAQSLTSAGARTARQLAFHDDMRKLWEDHVTWTRLAIVTFADGSAGFPATADRLLQNQADLGESIKPFYGDAAGERLTELLRGHISIAVEILKAARDGDTALLADARTRWYANADEIADFLSAANAKYWPADVMRDQMRHHLDETFAEAAHELGGDHAASVADYEGIHAHILEMADMLSDGLIAAFPSRFS